MARKQLIRAAAALHPKLIMEPYTVLYEKHGFDVVYDMAHYCGGMTLYIPQVRTIFQDCLLTCAKADWLTRNFTFHALARKYGYSERTFRRMINGNGV
jgi:Mor family transcriptional regulator